MVQSLGPITQSTILFAVMLGMIAIGIQVLRRYRDHEAKDGAEASDMMTKFRELHAEGGLSDEEFRTIKTKLADDLRTAIKTDTQAEPQTELNAELNDSSSNS